MVIGKEAIRTPTIGITMGDPLGIGPEVLVRTVSEPLGLGMANFVVYGCNEVMTFTADRLGIRPNWSRIPHDSQRLERPIDDARSNRARARSGDGDGGDGDGEGG